MKKSFIFLILTYAIFAEKSAFARTEGSYLGINANLTKATHQYTSDGDISTTDIYAQKAEGSNVGFGLSYQYAFNKNGLFLAPELFYDRLNSGVRDNDINTIALDYRYGAKLNLGYDIFDNTAIYVTGGLSNLRYRVGGRSRDFDNQYTSLWGAGLSFYPHKNVAVNFEYNISKFNLTVRNSDLSDHTRSTAEVYKVGVAYHF